MKNIKIGNVCFNSDVLAGLKLTEAYARFDHIRRDIVKEAHQKANPKKKKGSVSKYSPFFSQI
jgi:hypothetical protein